MSTKNVYTTLGYWQKLCQTVLDEYKCRIVRVEKTRRNCHVKVTVEHLPTGDTRFMMGSTTPGDHRVHKQRIQVCRKVCRELAC